MTSVPVFELSGGALALDLANTVDKRPLPEAADLIGDYSDLVAWAQQAGVVDRRRAEELRDAARRGGRDATRVLSRALRLREAIFRVFSAIAAGRPAAAPELDVLRRETLSAYAHARLRRRAGAFAWELEGTPLESLLWPVALDALALLFDAESVAAVRECASDRCAWLFLDRSRNRSRRWCDMKICGNRAKSRRHYRRTREAAAE